MLKIKFRKKLVKEFKKHPDLYNEIRAELSMPRISRGNETSTNKYTINPKQDNLLATVDEDELIKSIVINLNYFIEYEREMREGDL